MSLAHLEVNFMQGDGYGSIFILHVAIQCDQHPLFKMLSFLQCVLLPSVSKSSGYESISLYFTSNGSAFLPVQCYRCWWIDIGSCVYRTSALTHWFVSAKQSVFTVLPVCMTPPPSHCSMPLPVTWKPAADVISLVPVPLHSKTDISTATAAIKDNAWTWTLSRVYILHGCMSRCGFQN